MKKLIIQVVINEVDGKVQIAKRTTKENINVADELMIYELLKDEAKSQIKQKFYKKTNGRDSM